MLVPLLLGGLGAAALVASPAAWPVAPAPPGARALPTAQPAAEPCGPRVGRAPDDPGRAAWFSLRSRIDRDGSLAGYVLRLAVAGRDAVAGLEMPAEAFAAGPFGDAVLVGADDGSTSRVRLVGPNGCARVVASAAEILRRATIDPAGGRLITFRLDRTARTDLGIWSAPIDDTSEAELLLPPLESSPELLERFGPTFATDLLWSLDGSRLVVQSCGESQCRFRIVEPASGRTWTLDPDGLGPALALVGDRLVAFGACAGRPCQIVEVDLASGAQRELAVASGSATVIPTRSGALLVAERVDGLAIVDLASGRQRSIVLPALLPGIALAVAGELGGVALPPGWIALAPDGRLPEPLIGGRLFAFDLESSRLVTLFGGNR
jgi:hypothetical protein